MRRLFSAATGPTLATLLALAACSSDATPPAPDGGTTPVLDEQAQYLADRRAEAAALPDPPTVLPTGKSSVELAFMIVEGEAIMRSTDTHPLTAPYIPQSGLTCGSCHLDAGKRKNLASTFIGVAASYPAFNSRDSSVVTLQDRINTCFMRSMNGMRLPEDSEALLAMTAYITWLSQGFPIQMNPDIAVAAVNSAFPNPHIVALVNAGSVDKAHGATLYDQDCAVCHGADGNGVNLSPPVWGPRAYNKGAGNSNVPQGASWVQFNMPPGNELTIPDQDAIDIMAYVNGQPHPAFVENDHLPNQGTTLVSGPEAVYHYGRYFTAEDRAKRVPPATAP